MIWPEDAIVVHAALSADICRVLSVPRRIYLIVDRSFERTIAATPELSSSLVSVLFMYVFIYPAASSNLAFSYAGESPLTSFGSLSRADIILRSSVSLVSAILSLLTSHRQYRQHESLLKE